MKITEVKPGVFAIDRPGAVSNVGMIRTTEGFIVIDTTSTPKQMQEVLQTAELQASDVSLLILTHADGDHIGGNKLFECPIVAHRLTLERMGGGKKPKRELPTETFEDQHQMKVGEVRIELTHTGGHKPDSSIVWLPEEKVLFPGDELFEGRYPFMLSSNVPVWIEVLKKLPSFGAEVVLPGHGTLCGEKEIALLLDYMEKTWERTSDHVSKGHSLEETLADEDFPRIENWLREGLREKNIELMYGQLAESGG